MSGIMLGSIGTITYGMTIYGHYDISEWNETGIRAWAYKSPRSPYTSASAKVEEDDRYKGWETGEDVTVTIWNNPFSTSKTYYRYNK